MNNTWNLHWFWNNRIIVTFLFNLSNISTTFTIFLGWNRWGTGSEKFLWFCQIIATIKRWKIYVEQCWKIYYYFSQKIFWKRYLTIITLTQNVINLLIRRLITVAARHDGIYRSAFGGTENGAGFLDLGCHWGHVTFFLIGRQRVVMTNGVFSNQLQKIGRVQAGMKSRNSALESPDESLFF